MLRILAGSPMIHEAILMVSDFFTKIYCGWLLNPAPDDRFIMVYPIIYRVSTMQDFFHPPYHLW
jgi:hypothetical protein